jgi:hypothetical protein
VVRSESMFEKIAGSIARGELEEALVRLWIAASVHDGQNLSLNERIRAYETARSTVPVRPSKLLLESLEPIR